MASITVNGRRVNVSDNFFSLPPEQQDATVDEIAAAMGGGEQMQAGLAEMSAMTQNPARARYDALPGWQKPLVALNDVVGQTARGAMGMVGIDSDKAAAGLRSGITGSDYETELANQRRLTAAEQKRSGLAGTAAEIVGGAGLAGGLAGKGLTLAGRAGTAGMTGLRGVLARSAMLAPEGAAYGALNAHARDQDMGTGAIIGGVAGPAGNLAAEGISAGIGKVAGAFNKKPPVPTAQMWKDKADDAFTRMRQEGVVFTKRAIDDIDTKLKAFLTKRAYYPANQPGIKGGLEMIADYKATGNMTPDGLMALRERFSGGYIMGNKKNNAMVREAIGLIDDILKNPKKGYVFASGDPKRAAQAYRDGMVASRNQHKLEDVEYLIDKGRRQGSTNITDNVNKRTKQLIGDKLLDPRSPMSRGWTPAEREAAKKASSWAFGERFLHAGGGAAPIGKLTGAMNATGLAYTVPQALAGNPIPLAIQGATAGAGLLSKAAADRMARKPVAELAKLIANGGIPPAQVQNVVQLLAHSKREALSRTLMALGINRGIAWNEAPAQ